MAFTCRLSDDLHERAKRHAERIGVSFSALVSIALDAYLTGKETPPGAPQPAPPVTASTESPDALAGRLASLTPAQRTVEMKRLERIAKLRARKP